MVIDFTVLILCQYIFSRYKKRRLVSKPMVVRHFSEPRKSQTTLNLMVSSFFVKNMKFCKQSLNLPQEAFADLSQTHVCLLC